MRLLTRTDHCQLSLGVAEIHTISPCYNLLWTWLIWLCLPRNMRPYVSNGVDTQWLSDYLPIGEIDKDDQEDWGVDVVCLA